MNESETLTVPIMLLRLLGAGLIGALIGYERRLHHKAIGIAGMVLVAVGSATYMLLAKHLTSTDPSAIGLAVGTSLWWLGAIVGMTTAAVLFFADLFPSTRQQIEQNAEQVEQRVEHAEEDAEHAQQRVAQAEARAAERTKETG
jgi:uncharacterized membrane protein YhiD involved in acid resistance